MKRKALLILLCYSCYLMSQENKILNRAFDRLRIETPNEASFNKYIDHPIDLYNGIPDISIPIYTLSENKINIPIELRYNTSGIKHDEESGWVGLGWNLNVGGVITRSAIGGIDKESLGLNDNIDYFKKVMNILDVDKYKINEHFNATPWSDEMRTAFNWYLTDPSIRKVQDEGRFSPDIFYYSYPGGSGKFILDFLKKEAVILNKKDNTIITLIFEPYSNPGFGQIFYDSTKLTGFRIITIDGTIHNFKLKSQPLFGTPGFETISGETYLLTESIYANNQSVTYKYETKDYSKYSYLETLKSYMPGSMSRVPHSSIVQAFGGYYNPSNLMNGYLTDDSFKADIFINTPLSWTSEFYLAEIETENSLIRFNGSSRKDIPSGLKLDNIEIISKQKTNTVVKNIKFQYDYFASETNSNNGTWYKKIVNRSGWTDENFSTRLKLLSVETTTGTNTIDKYKFHYNSKLLPRKDSFSADYWGYYNGKLGNTTFIPDYNNLYLHDNSGSFIEKVRQIYKLSGVTPANRAFDFEASKAGILEGIEYPTGGYTEFNYEPQSFFYDHAIPTINEIKETNLNEHITLSDDNSSFTTDKKSSNFSLQKEISIGISISLRKGIAYEWKDLADTKVYVFIDGVRKDLSTEAGISQWCYEQYIKETQGSTKIRDKSFKINITLPKTNGTFSIDLPDILGDQSKYINDQGCLLQFGATIPKSYILDAAESRGGGVRIKEILSYSDKEKTEKLVHTRYTYIDPETNKSSGLLHIEPKFHNEYENIHDILGLQQIDENSKICRVYYYFGAVKSNKIEICKDIVDTNPYESCNNVAYSIVKKEEIKNDGNSHITIYKYHNNSPKRLNLVPQLNDPLNGRIREIMYYKNDTIIKKEVLTYSTEITKYNSGLFFYDPINFMKEILKEHSPLIYFSLLPLTHGILDCAEGKKATPAIHDRSYEDIVLPYNRMRLIQYPIDSYTVLLSEKETLQDNISYKETYTYNINTQQLVSKTVHNRFDDVLKYNYIYPNNINCDPYIKMTDKNIIDKIIEEKIFRNSKYIGGRFNEFSIFNEDLICPSKIYIAENNKKEDTAATFNCSGVNKDIYPSYSIAYSKYDNYGNPTYLEDNAVKIVYLWSYSGQYPIAEIKSATYDEVNKIININNLSAKLLPDDNDYKAIRALETSLKNALITTYTYKPLVGMTSMTDPRGVTTTYEYDSFGRLSKVKDANGKVINTYDYHYQNQ